MATCLQQEARPRKRSGAARATSRLFPAAAPVWCNASSEIGGKRMDRREFIAGSLALSVAAKSAGRPGRNQAR